MLEFAPLPLKINPKRTPEDKKRTSERLEKELAKDLAATNGAARTHVPPARKGTSLNPNETFMFDLVDSHFLNREAYEEAKAIQEGWKPQAWKGFVWYGRIHEPNSKPERVWTAPSMDLQWTGAEWEPYKRQDGTVAVPTGAVPSNISIKIADALQRAIKVGKSGGIAEVEMNAVYVEYLADPVAQKNSLFVTLSAFIRSAKRIWEIKGKYGEKAEIYMTRDDIFDEFAINLMHRIEKNQYTHIGKMQNWIHYIWERYFFPKIQTEINAYIDRNTYVNSLDPDLEGYEEQSHSVSLFQIENEQAQREQEGYHAPVSRDRIFRQMNNPTQAIVQMLAEGLTQNEIAVNLNISTRQLRRRMDKAIEEGETVRAVLHSVQGCAEEDKVLPWPTDETFDIMACAAEETAFEPLLGAKEAAKLLCVHEKTVQAMARSGEIPCLRFGKYWRFRASVLDAWVRDRLTSDHQSRRAS